MSQCVTLLRTPGEAECLIPNPPLPWPQIIREYNSRCLFLPSLSPLSVSSSPSPSLRY